MIREPSRAVADSVSKLRVSILQPSRAPYRIALFDSLSKQFAIKAFYVAGADDPARVWKTSDLDTYDSYDFPNASLNAFGKRFSFSLRSALAASKDTDVVVTCTNVLELPTYLLAAAVARFRGKAVLCLITVSEDYAFFRGHSFLARPLNFAVGIAVGILIKASHFGIAYSKNGVRLAANWGVEAISSSQYYPLEQEYGASQKPRTPRELDSTQPLRACIVGYLSPRKGVWEFLEARKRLLLDEKLHVTIAGPLSQNNPYVSALLSSPWKNVTFCGTLDSAGKARLFQESDLMIFPTQHDSWGFVANEAMYFGVPVLATDHSEAAKDLIKNHENGWLYKSDDTLLKAVEEASDKVRLKAMGATAKRDVIKFNEGALDTWKTALTKAYLKAKTRKGF